LEPVNYDVGVLKLIRTTLSINKKEVNLRRRKVAPESKSPITSTKGDIMKLVGGAY